MKRLFAISLIILLPVLAWILWGGATTSPPDPRTGREPSPSVAPAPGKTGEEALRDAVDFLLGKFPEAPAPSMVAAKSSALAGESLSRTHCAVCHLYPGPELLPKLGWVDLFLMKRSFFPNIGLLNAAPRPLEAQLFAQVRALKRPHIWGAGQVEGALSTTQFFQIVAYYLQQAPASSLPQIDKPAPAQGAAPFEIHQLPGLGENHHEGFSMAAFEDDRLFLGQYGHQALLHIDLSGHVLRRWSLPGIPVHAVRQGDDLLITVLGKELGGVDKTTGALIRLADIFGSGRTILESLLTDLYRPIRTVFPTFDGLSGEDAIVLSFGLLYGSVDWYKYSREESSMLLHKRLVDAAGAVGIHIADINGNGREDIVVLIAQAEESLYLFHNEGQGRFRKERIFQRLPAFGFNSLTVADINGDGHLDVVTTNGDNGDLLMSTPLRNYHGVRVHLNDGTGGFKESYFYPMHGATQVLAEDFTGNGKIDLAAISYFPDTQAQPMETFVFLENLGSKSSAKDASTGVLHFAPRHLPGTENKPWISMIAADVDHNGRPDIILTSLKMAPMDAPELLPSALILFNTSQPKSPAY